MLSNSRAANAKENWNVVLAHTICKSVKNNFKHLYYPQQ